MAGFDDVIVGALGEQKAYIIFGRATASSSTIFVDSLRCEQGVVLRGTNANFAAGQTVSMLGDFNGDGRADVIVSAPDGGFDTRLDQVSAGMTYRSRHERPSGN